LGTPVPDRGQGYYLVGISQYVQACVQTPQEELTPLFQSTLGVKQGCPLSPTLFGLYVDQLETVLKQHILSIHPPELNGVQIPCLLYADDVVLLSKAPIGLQHCLDVLGGFCETQGLTVNLKKTQVIIFNDTRHAQSYLNCVRDVFHYMGTPVVKVEQYVYLGVTFHRKTGYKVAVETLAVAGRKAMFGMMRRCAVLGITDIKLKAQLFDTLVRPILSYGCEVWGTYYMHSVAPELEKVHKLFLRKLLQVRTSVSDFVVLSEVGRFPLNFCWQKQILKFYNRMVNMVDLESSRLLVVAFQWVQQQSAQHSWMAHIRSWMAEQDAAKEGQAVGTVNPGSGGCSSSAVAGAEILIEHTHPHIHGTTPFLGGGRTMVAWQLAEPK